MDPSGFQDEPTTPGVYDVTDGNGNLVEILVVGPPRPPPPQPPPPQGPVEGPREATQVGDVRPLADMSVWGIIGGWSRQPPATLEEWLKPVVIANQLQQGAMRGLGEMLLNTGKLSRRQALRLNQVERLDYDDLQGRAWTVRRRSGMPRPCEVQFAPLRFPH